MRPWSDDALSMAGRYDEVASTAQCSVCFCILHLNLVYTGWRSAQAATEAATNHLFQHVIHACSIVISPTGLASRDI